MDRSKQEVINSLFPMPKLLAKYYKVFVSDGNLTFHCPFPEHPGRDTRKSAKYFPDTNKAYCFTEQRIYSSYDILRFKGFSDAELTEVVFKKVGAFIPEDVELDDIISPQDYLEDVSLAFMRGKCNVRDFNKPLKSYLKALMKSLDKSK
jgi:hypothetical protein